MYKKEEFTLLRFCKFVRADVTLVLYDAKLLFENEHKLTLYPDNADTTLVL